MTEDARSDDVAGFYDEFVGDDLEDPTSAGMTPETAIAAVLLYRIATYYAPPLWGFPAMLWLQRNRYL